MLRVKVKLFSDDREIIAMMTWETVGGDSGDYEFPLPGDMVLVAFAEGDIEQALVIRRLSSKEDPIALKALDGHRVAKSRKSFFINSPEAIHLTKDAEGTEPLVLGAVFKQFATDQLAELATQSGEVKALADATSSLLSQVQSLVSALTSFASSLTIEAAAGAALSAQLIPITAQLPTVNSNINSAGSASNTVKSNLEALSSSPIGDDLILSDLAFTEKGAD
jgi:hypothetical protein